MSHSCRSSRSHLLESPAPDRLPRGPCSRTRRNPRPRFRPQDAPDRHLLHLHQRQHPPTRRRCRAVSLVSCRRGTGLLPLSAGVQRPLRRLRTGPTRPCRGGKALPPLYAAKTTNTPAPYFSSWTMPGTHPQTPQPLTRGTHQHTHQHTHRLPGAYHAAHHPTGSHPHTPQPLHRAEKRRPHRPSP